MSEWRCVEMTLCRNCVVSERRCVGMALCWNGVVSEWHYVGLRFVRFCFSTMTNRLTIVLRSDTHLMQKLRKPSNILKLCNTFFLLVALSITVKAWQRLKGKGGRGKIYESINKWMTMFVEQPLAKPLGLLITKSKICLSYGWY